MLMTMHRVAHAIYKSRIPVLPRLIYVLQYFVSNSAIPPSAQIGKGTKFAYRGIGVVIHKNAVIGKNCMIGQGMTIGGRSKHIEVPIIGDNVYLGAGSRVLGPIKIGNNVIIGPNAVVLQDIPDNCIAVGIPARIIKENIKVEDFI
ncbi:MULTISPECIES: serine O-acetyltransferase [Myroides]|uniref:serine O-acetyltransferase n=1 Tax=Myroides odoratus TaxID=256 RepID=UPI0007660B3E|nr:MULTISPECIES: serine O-acetyltransferase [Myroides]WHT37570.1 serine O-acetyltransferase [Myroides sp. mNGS23_01]